MSATTSVTDLAPELLAQCFGQFEDAGDLAAALQTCTAFNTCSDDSSIWRRVANRLFDDLETARSRKLVHFTEEGEQTMDSIDWKQELKRRHRLARILGRPILPPS